MIRSAPLAYLATATFTAACEIAVCQVKPNSLPLIQSITLKGQHAPGEGVIAVLYERDQAAIAFDVRGGENGSAQVQFLRRDGSVIAQSPVRQLGEYAVRFHSKDDVPDIAGFVLMNADPQGVAIDNIRFDHPTNLS